MSSYAITITQWYILTCTQRKAPSRHRTHPLRRPMSLQPCVHVTVCPAVRRPIGFSTAAFYSAFRAARPAHYRRSCPDTADVGPACFPRRQSTKNRHAGLACSDPDGRAASKFHHAYRPRA